MKTFRVMAIRYGYSEVEAESEAEALEKTKNMAVGEFDWSAPDDEQVVEEIDY